MYTVVISEKDLVKDQSTNTVSHRAEWPIDDPQIGKYLSEWHREVIDKVGIGDLTIGNLRIQIMKTGTWVSNG